MANKPVNNIITTATNRITIRTGTNNMQRAIADPNLIKDPISLTSLNFEGVY